MLSPRRLLNQSFKAGVAYWSLADKCNTHAVRLILCYSTAELHSTAAHVGALHAAAHLPRVLSLGPNWLHTELCILQVHHIGMLDDGFYEVDIAGRPSMEKQQR
jgi:hypothetical protein